MKHLYLLLFLTSILTTESFSQIVSGNVFLKGSYVEIGVNSCGCYVTPGTPPAGYHPNSSGLGVVADSDKDGWDTGSPFYCGDYTVPGAPVEGWAVQIGADIYYNTDRDCIYEDIIGAVTAYSAGATLITADWEGSIEDYDANIRQQTILHPGDLYFITKITIVNNSETAYENVYYERNADPDNESVLGGGATTDNNIVSNPPLSTDALVSAEGLLYGCYMATGSRYANARVAMGLFLTSDGTPEEVYTGSGGYVQSGSEINDIANSIAFYFPSIAAHDSVTIAFAYIFDPAEAEEALAATSDIITGCSAVTDAAPSSITETTALLSWTATYGADSYKVKYRPTGGSWITTTTLSPSLPLSGLTSCTNYQFSVSANCDGSVMTPFNGSFMTACTPCATAPAGLSVTNITSSSAKLHWSPVAGATSYKIVYGSAGGSSLTTTTTSTVKLISGLSAGTVYNFKVRALCGGGSASPYSAPVSFTTLLRIGNFNGPSAELTVFPNPASDIIIVSSQSFNDDKITFIISDMAGRKVYETTFTVNEEGSYMINVKDISQGIYMLTAEQNYDRINRKIIIEH